MPQVLPIEQQPAAGALRPPAEVMRPDNMGASFATRLSFSRLLIRRLAAAKAQVVRRDWKINDAGHGRAVYSVQLDGRDYSLVAFSSPLADASRSDRVIATAWDSTYALYDGIPSDAALRQLENNLPKQEGGRYDDGVLILSRANKSVRLFEHVVARLAAGEQPDVQKIVDTGYLMRTTAVYGNGKFGIADREKIMSRPPFAPPFQAEMLAVWLIRGFTQDLVDHVARARGGARACPLSPRLKRYLGIGNSTGLGMAPFLINHPALIHRWAAARETALARVCAVARTDAPTHRRLQQLAARADAHLAQWRSSDHRQTARLALLRREWRELRGLVDGAAGAAHPWRALLDAAAMRSAECRELSVSLLLEAHVELVDELAGAMSGADSPVLSPAMPVGRLRERMSEDCRWALAVDFSAPRSTRRLWYLAEEKEEPRVGARAAMSDAAELPMNIALRLRRLYDDLANIPAEMTLAEFLAAKPQHRDAARRAQTLADHPYAEIQGNLIDENCLPIDLLRWKLSFLGATKFDPKSDLWVRIVLFQGAPCCDEIGGDAADIDDADDWWMPALEFAI